MKRLGLLVPVAAIACFAPTLRYGFVWDDYDNIVWNSRVRSFSAENVRWMFTDTKGHYIPVTWMSLALDAAIWGEDADGRPRARGFHLTNILLHGANAAWLYGVLLLLLRGADESRAQWGAAIGALLFAVHPQRVESVAWITERRDLLMGFFALASLYFHLRGGRWLLLSVPLFALSLLSKTMSMGLPLVMLILDVWPLRRFGRRAALELAPYVLLTGAAIGVTHHAQADVGALMTPQQYGWQDAAREPGVRFCSYLGKMLVPWNLAPIYPYRPGPFVFKHGAMWAILVVGTALLLRLRKRWPAATAAWLAYAALIAPVLGIFQAGVHFAADRYSYLATIPFAALAAAVAVRSTRAAAPFLVVLGALVLLTLRQQSVWADDVRLWNHQIAVEPHEVAYYNRAIAHWMAGDAASAERDFDEAIRLNGDQPKFYENRGDLRRDSGQRGPAIADYTEALKRAPDAWEVRYKRGKLRMEAEDRAGAAADLRAALDGAPPGWPPRAGVEALLETLK